ncbi:MAG: hypothetical protein EXX96DRAFT_175339 [Benjaminiella poitrasii]|nr:MAG: hypothetical protein EXX96DRAFT_175339 [Benjaminiella poitrasii]
MLHLVNQPSMRERIAILQAQFIYHSLHFPKDTLLSKLLLFLQTSSNISQWYKLIKSPLWRNCAPSADTMDTRTFKHLRQTFLQNNLESHRDGPNSKLLSACQPTLTVDPIFWLCTIRILTLPAHTRSTASTCTNASSFLSQLTIPCSSFSTSYRPQNQDSLLKPHLSLSAGPSYVPFFINWTTFSTISFLRLSLIQDTGF